MIRKNEILTEIADRHRTRIMKPPSNKIRVFNDVEVEKIRSSFLRDGDTVAQLARDLEVRTQTINNILRGYGAYKYDEEIR